MTIKELSGFIKWTLLQFTLECLALFDEEFDFLFAEIRSDVFSTTGRKKRKKSTVTLLFCIDTGQRARTTNSRL